MRTTVDLEKKMIRNVGRTLRAAAVTAVVGVALAAAPANAAAPVWETLSQPVAGEGGAYILPLDAQNAFAKTRRGTCGSCRLSEKVWQKTGNAWKELTPPADASVTTLTATATDDLWAIGRKDTSTGVFRIHHYDGTRWSGNLNPDTRNLEFQAAEAVGRKSLWAVGNSRAGGRWTPVVTHWNGTSWNTTTFDQFSGDLAAIDVRAENDIWAVGHRDAGGTANDRFQALALHFDGTRWTEVPVPGTAKVSTLLQEVRSNGPDDVWVSGSVLDERGQGAPLTGAYVNHWDGTAWTRRDVPGATFAHSFAVYGGQVHVGVSGAGNLLRWTGGAWEVVGGIQPGMNGVSSLASTPDGSLYLAGSSGFDSVFGGLTYYLQRLAAPAAR
ncbi:hypothetical protein ACFWAR_31275 [Streptomyces sp. NPDC059917]|uniref:hypothetical protein n=1 Tax=Streptomyces sp. NPDC059917 TaxID=3347002 RepID=UPI00364C4C1A